MVDEGCLLLGFLCYKSGFVLLLWDDYKPKVKTMEDLQREKVGPRPSLPDLGDDPDVELDERVKRLRY